ncbi:MAG TPA: hypothetical protein VLA42_10805 [Verrucomicrobiae bacterium]|jgi:hypothetical protein|nr:hypothetical protein [Verrucomicrobiae bacterium]
MKLPALAIVTAFALGIACGLEIAHRSNSHQFVALLLCSSKNSTTQGFLDTVAPAIAIISSGEDNPSPELLERLEASGARVLRTDRDGAVHIVTDGDRLEISCFVVCAELPTVTTSRRAEAPNQNQNNQ